MKFSGPALILAVVLLAETAQLAESTYSKLRGQRRIKKDEEGRSLKKEDNDKKKGDNSKQVADKRAGGDFGGGGGSGGGGKNNKNDKKGGKDKNKSKNKKVINGPNFSNGGLTASPGVWTPSVFAGNGGTSFTINSPAAGGGTTNVNAGTTVSRPQTRPVINNNAGGTSSPASTTYVRDPTKVYIPNTVNNPPQQAGVMSTTVKVVNNNATPNQQQSMQQPMQQQPAQTQQTQIQPNPPVYSRPVVANTAPNPGMAQGQPQPMQQQQQQQQRPMQQQPMQQQQQQRPAPVPSPASSNTASFPSNWDVAPQECVKANKPDWMWKDKEGTGRFNIEQMYARVPQCLYDDHCANGCCVRFHSGFKICQNPDTMSAKMTKWCSGSCADGTANANAAPPSRPAISVNSVGGPGM